MWQVIRLRKNSQDKLNAFSMDQSVDGCRKGWVEGT